MTEISIESKTEHSPMSLTQQVDAAVEDDYEKLRTDAAALARAAGGLIERMRKIPGSDADARLGALKLAENCFVDADFHLRKGHFIEHPEESPSAGPHD